MAKETEPVIDQSKFAVLMTQLPSLDRKIKSVQKATRPNISPNSTTYEVSVQSTINHTFFVSFTKEKSHLSLKETRMTVKLGKVNPDGSQSSTVLHQETPIKRPSEEYNTISIIQPLTNNIDRLPPKKLDDFFDWYESWISLPVNERKNFGSFDLEETENYTLQLVWSGLANEDISAEFANSIKELVETAPIIFSKIKEILK